MKKRSDHTSKAGKKEWNFNKYLLWIIISIILGPLGIFGCIAALFTPLLMLGELILHVMCIVKGINGQRLIIPGISEFANKL